jgi:hypothetical protein
MPSPRSGTVYPDKSMSTIYLEKIRQAVADYIESEGCGCCEKTTHGKHGEALAMLLAVPKYEDGSGYDFARFRTVK